MNQKNILTAFDLVTEEIDKLINHLDEASKNASEQNLYDEAKAHLDKAKKLYEVKRKVLTLKEDIESILNNKTRTRKRKTNKNRQKLKEGLRTHQDQYRIPILEAILELGGKGKVRDILNKVYEKMKDKLNSYDLENLRSGAIRWKNAAQWCRDRMVKEGLLSNHSPRGTWEITEKGIAYLNEHKSKS